MNMSINTLLFFDVGITGFISIKSNNRGILCAFLTYVFIGYTITLFYENINFYMIFSKCWHWRYCVLLVVMTCSRGPCLYPFHFNFNFAVNIYLPVVFQYLFENATIVFTWRHHAKCKDSCCKLYYKINELNPILLKKWYMRTLCVCFYVCLFVLRPLVSTTLRILIIYADLTYGPYLDYSPNPKLTHQGNVNVHILENCMHYLFDK